MVKLAFVIPTLYKGGAERVASELSQALYPEIELDLVLFDKKVSYPYKGNLHILNIPISTSKLWFFEELYKINLRAIALKKLAKNHNITAFLAFDERASLSAILSGVPTISYIHKPLTMADKEKPVYVRAFLSFYRRIYSKAKCIVSPSYRLTEELKQLLPANCFKTIPNPINIQRAFKLASEKGPDDEGYALNIGRAVPLKNQLKLLNLYEKHPLYIISPGGPLIEELIKKAPSNVQVISRWVDNVYPWYKHSSYYVSLSDYEGFSMTIAEALALDKPSLSTDCPYGPAEILGDVKEDLGNGFVRRECGITGPLVNDVNLEYYKKYAKMMFELSFGSCFSRAKQFDIHTVKKAWLELFKHIL